MNEYYESIDSSERSVCATLETARDATAASRPCTVLYADAIIHRFEVMVTETIT